MLEPGWLLMDVCVSYELLTYMRGGTLISGLLAFLTHRFGNRLSMNSGNYAKRKDERDVLSCFLRKKGGASG